jgi:peptidyl-prolyl cis-trans isomerase SurA
MRRHFLCFLHVSGMARLLAIGLSAAVLLAPAGSGAQEQLRIVAVVNSDVISQWDLQQRIAFIMVSTGQPRSQENADRLMQPALRQLIDEKLEAKEAKDRGVEVIDQEVNAAIGEIEQANHMPPGGLTQILGQVGLPISVMNEQLRTRIAWQRTVARRVHALNDVTDEEVDEAVAEYQANNDKPQSLVSEILLTVDTPESEPQVRATAERLVQQVRAGTPFGNLARQFSETTASSSEGDLGWVQQGQLDPKIDAALTRMKPGEVSEPIRLVNGYHIVELRDRRLPREIAAFGSEILRLSHASLPLTPDASAADITAASDKLRQATRDVKSCEDLNGVSAKIGGASGNVGSMNASQLPAVLQPVVSRLQLNQPSPPTFVEDHVTVLMICARSGGEAEAGAPSRDEIRERLFLKRVDAVSRRYIRDLRLAAYVDIRQ